MILRKCRQLSLQKKINAMSAYIYFENSAHILLAQGRTKSDDTGPGSAYSEQHYLYIETSDPRDQGEDAIVNLQLPDIGQIPYTQYTKFE